MNIHHDASGSPAAEPEDDLDLDHDAEALGVDERVSGLGAWGVSIVAHALILLVVGTIVVAGHLVNEQPPIELVTIPAPPPQPEREPERRVIRDADHVTITSEEQVDTPVVEVFELPPEEPESEDPVESEQPVRGREDAVSRVEMASTAAMMTMGAGPGASGAFGYRTGGGRRYRAGTQGGSRASECAVEAALKWFAIHQSPNGQWDVDAYPNNCQREGQRCEPGRGHVGPGADAACTGYALLCYLGAGYDHTHMSRWRPVVKSGVEWLVASQQADGSWGRNYENGVCAMALAEAYGLSGDVALREPAQRAVDHLIAVQAQDGPADSGYAGLGWDYKRPNPGRIDSSVSGWCVMALKSAKAAGLATKGSLEGCKRWLEGAWRSCNPEWETLTQYDRSYFPYTWNATADTFEHQRLPCVGLLAAVFLGHRRGDVLLESLANTVIEEQLPAGYPCNTYWLYYNTLGMFQIGGERWERWNKQVRDMLVDAQRKEEGCFDGSWDFAGTRFHGHETGRLLSTAYCCLSLEVYYRYLPMALDARVH
ncbi:MAG: prenyltransferase/squalene oxidase repeat-containing protein [Planctomycetota bacterium]